MTSIIRILHLEDIRSDADIVLRELKRANLSIDYRWVTNKKDFETQLKEFSPDVVLSDHVLPDISSEQALRLVQQLEKKISFILITATVSEEFAVAMMREGVSDYILKDRLQRLPQAIVNAYELAQTEEAKEKHYKEIVAQEKRFRALIENISDAIMMVDEKGYVIYQSPSVQRITGFQAEQVLHKRFVDFLPEGSRAEASSFFAELTKHPGLAQQKSIRILHSNGSSLWAESSITNMLHDEAICAIIVNFRDITERYRQQQLRERSEAKLQTIFKNTKVAYVLLDSDYKVQSFNPLAASRYKRELGINLVENYDLLPDIHIHSNPSTYANFQKVMSGDKVQYEVSFKQENGSVCWYQVDMFSVRSQENTNLGLIIASEDITERKNADLEKEKMTADLLHHIKDLEQFAYIVSHNLRSPVANIRGLANILQEHQSISDTDFKRCLEGLSLAAGKLDSVITDLNFILQIRKGVDELKEQVSFATILQNIQTGLYDQIEKSRAEFTTNFEVEEIYTLKSYLHSILINLIANALKYRRPDRVPLISISTRTINGAVELKVCDNGMGIDLEKHGSKIFGLYKKFHDHVEGKGMGLYMVKTQVELLGGSIGLTSELNKGTCFTIVL